MNIRDRRAIHHAAGQSLANAKGNPKRILLIYLGIITAFSLASSLVSVLLSNRIADTGGLSNMGLRSVLSTAQTVLPLVQSLVFLGLEMGYCIVALRIARGEEFSQDTLSASVVSSRCCEPCCCKVSFTLPSACWLCTPAFIFSSCCQFPRNFMRS